MNKTSMFIPRPLKLIINQSIMKLKSSFFSCSFLQIIILLVLLHEGTCSAAATSNKTACPPSHCGKFINITYPFRLKGDPATCGNSRYELTCVNNNKSTLLLPLFQGKNYYVMAINYNNLTIRLVDPAITEEANNCSSRPRYSLSRRNFSDSYGGPYEEYQNVISNHFPGYSTTPMFQHVFYMKCSNPVRDDPLYVDTDTSPCSSSVNSQGHHVYAVVGDMKVGNFKPHCHLNLVTPVSVFDREIPEQQAYSYDEIHRMLEFGFELSWMRSPCQHLCTYPDCCLNETSKSLQCNLFQVDPCLSPLGIPITCHTGPHIFGVLTKGRIFLEAIILKIGQGSMRLLHLKVYIGDRSFGIEDSKLGLAIGRVAGYIFLPYTTVRLMFGLILFFGKMIHIFWTRHTSVYEDIENFLQGNSLMPIRYSYKDIKKMTRSFIDKLGEGGYGTVYKGKLRSGPFVAIKMLGKPKSNGQEFISEVATIGRIHHDNVVQLIGFCAEASKRALIYEFMPNGSLDRYISSKGSGTSLTYNQMYTISLGVARGIAYLHQGCDMQILHFDIKPHNILLDENFIPKVSDFGLARLYPIDNSIVILTAARGTIGYMAPELFYHNIGGVSYKADVYSFGMLLMEMANRRRNLNPCADNSSQNFLPLWIYDQLIEEREIKMGEVTNEEKNNVKKMFIVSLWCIQLRPDDRPSMNKAIEMLEGEVESIIIPPKPSLYPEIIQDLENSDDESTLDDTSG